MIHTYTRKHFSFHSRINSFQQKPNNQKNATSIWDDYDEDNKENAICNLVVMHFQAYANVFFSASMFQMGSFDDQ